MLGGVGRNIQPDDGDDAHQPVVEGKILSILMKTQTGKDFSFNDRLVSIVTVIRIDVSEYTAKHRPLPEAMR